MPKQEGEFVEYDLDNEDEDWLTQFNSDSQERLPAEKCGPHMPTLPSANPTGPGAESAGVVCEMKT